MNRYNKKTHNGRGGLARLIAAALVFALVFPLFAASDGDGGLTSHGSTSYTALMSGIEKQATAYYMLDRVNDERKAVSVGALQWDAALEEAAIKRAREIAVYFSHTRPTGAIWYTASSKMNAENIFVAYKATSYTANEAWMDSDSHRKNRLNSAYRSYAAAAFQARDGAVYWVEVFSLSASSDTDHKSLNRDRINFMVRVNNSYLCMKTRILNRWGNAMYLTNLRAGYPYTFSLKSRNGAFDASYATFGKGVFTSSNSNVASIDPVTGNIIAKKGGVAVLRGKLSVYSDMTFTKTVVVRPKKVRGETAAGKTHAVTLHWDLSAGSKGYEIYRSTSLTGTYTRVATVGSATTTYTNGNLTSGKTYYYKIRGYVTKSGSTTRYTGYFSDPVSAKSL